MRITGVDEVGRGALAGPIVSASFTTSFSFLNQTLSQLQNLQKDTSSKSFVKNIDRLKKLIEFDIKVTEQITDLEEEAINTSENEKIISTLVTLNDSKKVTKLNREKLYKILTKIGEFKLGIVDSTEIDKIGLQKANIKSMINTLPMITKGGHFILTDHLDISKVKLSTPMTANITAKYLSFDKGDSRSFCIAAASIIAKVSRDKIMADFHTPYPKYGFNVHVGYGTKQHIESIKLNGPCKIHRLSYKIFKDANNIARKSR